MPYITMKPTELSTIYGVAIDNVDTVFSEDCYQCKETNLSEVTLSVMVAIPPVSKIIQNRFVEALKIQHATGKAKNLPRFFNLEDMKAHTFNVHNSCEVLIVEFKLLNGVVMSEAIYLAERAFAEQYSYQEYNNTLRAKRHTRIVADILSTKPHLYRKFSDPFIKQLVEENGISGELIYGAMELFNHTCRHVAKNNKIPYVAIYEKEKNTKFRISKGYSNFNRALRDPCAYINLSNLVYFLKKGNLLYNEADLYALLPQ